MTNSSTKDGGGVQRGRHNTTLLAWIFFFQPKDLSPGRADAFVCVTPAPIRADPPVLLSTQLLPPTA